jgi:hypothetical protein
MLLDLPRKRQGVPRALMVVDVGALAVDHLAELPHAVGPTLVLYFDSMADLARTTLRRSA